MPDISSGDRRKQITEEIQDLATEYVQTWDEFEDAMVVGSYTVVEVLRGDGSTICEICDQTSSPCQNIGMLTVALASRVKARA